MQVRLGNGVQAHQVLLKDNGVSQTAIQWQRIAGNVKIQGTLRDLY